MLINWFTVAAQVVNFLILVWLLKRFLYRPILHAIDQREQGIAAQLAEAKAKQAEAQKQRDDLQHKNDAFDKERAALWKKATDDAGAERQRLLAAAGKEADDLRTKRHESLQNEQRNLQQAIIRWTQQQVFGIARKALQDLAGASLEQCMTAMFVKKLISLTGSAKEQVASSLKASNQPARIRSAFDLSPTERQSIESAVKQTFAGPTQIVFETAPELVSGIELAAGGQKVAWSIADYLATLEKSAAELLRPDATAAPRPVANGSAKADRPAPPSPKLPPVPPSGQPQPEHAPTSTPAKVAP